MTHPDGGSGTGPGGDGGTGPPKFHVPGPRTPLNALIDCGRALGPAVLAVARLFTWRNA